MPVSSVSAREGVDVADVLAGTLAIGVTTEVGFSARDVAAEGAPGDSSPHQSAAAVSTPVRNTRARPGIRFNRCTRSCRGLAAPAVVEEVGERIEQAPTRLLAPSAIA